MSEANILYKVLALKLLSSAAAPITNAQVAEFFVKNGYTDYFTVQRIMNELVQVDLVSESLSHNVTLFFITDDGIETLYHMRERLTPSMENDIRQFFAIHGIAMEEKNAIMSDYYRSADGGFDVHLTAAREDTKVVDLTLHVGSEDMAKTLITNWKRDYEKVYDALMDILI